MIKFSMKAEVFCSDGLAGRSTYVVGKPDNHEITYLVVKTYLPPFREYLVPADQIKETSDSRLHLKCRRGELNKMELFEHEEFIQTELPAYLLSSDVPDVPATPWATMQPVDTFVQVKRKNIPPNESVLRRCARVQATDGYVGRVNELLIDSGSMQVTHLTVLVGHPFEERKIILSALQIDKMDEETIHLKLDRQSVEALPATPIQRWL